MLVKVFPAKDFLVTFLQAREFKIVDSNPQVLHYLGNSRTELMILLARDKPDLLINHSFVSFKQKRIPQVYHYLKDEKDLFKIGRIYTNSFELCENYYQKLGLQKDINVVKMKRAKPLKEIFKLNADFSKLFHNWERFKMFMRWNS